MSMCVCARARACVRACVFVIEVITYPFTLTPLIHTPTLIFLSRTLPSVKKDGEWFTSISLGVCQSRLVLKLEMRRNKITPHI